MNFPVKPVLKELETLFIRISKNQDTDSGSKKDLAT